MTKEITKGGSIGIKLPAFKNNPYKRTSTVIKNSKLRAMLSCTEYRGDSKTGYPLICCVPI